MAATGAALGALAVGATAPASLPAIGIVAGMTSAWMEDRRSWCICASQIEGLGHDLIERRMMKDTEGNHLSPMAIGLGSMATGALNGALEAAQWTIAFSPLGKTAAAAKIQQSVVPKVAARISALPAFVKMAGMTAKNIVANDFLRIRNGSFLQDAIPIAIDEFQKAALLGWDMTCAIGDTMQDTPLRQSNALSLCPISRDRTVPECGDYRAR